MPKWRFSVNIRGNSFINRYIIVEKPNVTTGLVVFTTHFVNVHCSHDETVFEFVRTRPPTPHPHQYTYLPNRGRRIIIMKRKPRFSAEATLFLCIRSSKSSYFNPSRYYYTRTILCISYYIRYEL